MVTVRACTYCEKSCLGEGAEEIRLGGSYNVWYHQRCHAESQDRARYPQQRNEYVPYETPDVQLQWEKEKEILMEKHKLEIESYQKMLDAKDEERKEFMEQVMEKLGELENKFETKMDNVVQGMKDSADKVIAKMEQIDSQRDVKLAKLREEMVSSVTAVIKSGEGQKKNPTDVTARAAITAALRGSTSTPNGVLPTSPAAVLPTSSTPATALITPEEMRVIVDRVVKNWGTQNKEGLKRLSSLILGQAPAAKRAQQ